MAAVLLGMPGRAVAACPQMDEIRVMIAPASFANLTTHVAADAGFFAKQCLDARLVPVEATSVGFAQLLVGGLHFSEASVGDLLHARWKDLKLKAVVGESTGIPYALVVGGGAARPDRSTEYPTVVKDLAGKRVGLSRRATGIERLMRSLLYGAGLEAADVTYVVLRSAREQLDALQKATVDAVLMADAGPDLAVAAGLGVIAVDLRRPASGPAELGPLAGAFQVRVASDAFVRENADLVRRYALAYDDAARWIRDPANFDTLLGHARRRLTLEREGPGGERLFSDIVRQYAGFSAATISRRSFAAWHDFERRRGGLGVRIAFEDAVWSGASVTD